MKNEKLKEILIEQLAVDEDRIKPEADIYDDLMADSLDMVEIIMAVEEEFDIEIPDEDFENGKARTVGAIDEYITKRLAE